MFYGRLWRGAISTLTRLRSDGLSSDVFVADKLAVLHDAHTLLALDTLFNMVTRVVDEADVLEDTDL